MHSAISLAKIWEELADVLKENGIKLSPKGGGLVVGNTETDEELCKLSALKLRYVELIDPAP
jgi:ATP-dependent DNA helicase RecQ